MKLLATVLFTVTVAACGGKNQGPAAPAAPAEGDDPATPFNDGAVKASLAAMAGVDACGVEASTTMGAHLETQRKLLEGEGESKSPVEETFLCRARADDAWSCEWSVFGTPGPDAPDPEDPCAGECCSGYIIMFKVENDGTIRRDSIGCNAPG